MKDSAFKGVIRNMVLGVAALLLASPLHAAPLEPARDFGCAAPLRIAAFEFGSWFHGDNAGITPEILGVMAERSGCQFTFVPVSRLDVWGALERGEIDLIPNSIRTREREELARFVLFLKIRNIMITRRDLPDAPDTLDGFVAKRDTRFGVLAGFLYGSYFDFRLHSLLGDDRVALALDPRQLFDMLRRQEVDVILAPVTNFYYHVPEMERQTRFRVVDTDLDQTRPSGFAFSRAAFSGPQVDNWMRLMEQMRREGTIESLIGRHLPPRLAPTLVIQ